VYACICINILIVVSVTIKQLFPSFSCTQSREPVRRDLLNLAPATFLFPRYASHEVGRANFNAQHAKTWYDRIIAAHLNSRAIHIVHICTYVYIYIYIYVRHMYMYIQTHIQCTVQLHVLYRCAREFIRLTCASRVAEWIRFVNFIELARSYSHMSRSPLPLSLSRIDRYRSNTDVPCI